MKNLTNFKILLLAFGLFSGMAGAQAISSKTVKTTVSGTSTMHDWTMTSTSGTFSGTVAGNAINNIQYNMGAKSLKSGKGAMDGNAYKALKADKFPNITFTATSVNIGKGTITGKLKVTDVTKTVSFPVTVAKSGNAYTITGTESIKMSEFGVTPPSFMMNTVKTGDEIKITVNVSAN
ncbi:YceI family protein [Chryseobacterium sp. HSC-36S06]|uniref:YceI family protein n=1 Tax=Chryseobacterium sp. HSC-36S06 TaxID=2910970 RepID=UPI0020A19764|nr:YceI family protein [Chryseobacterium sp. HSC-36S06]MCP2038624.1 polyisoprenoid-binding protein YceI [Chryseobacterium sp. HSC-36S06]